MRLARLAALLLLAAAAASPARADDLDVAIANRSEPELCAEKDNVALEFASPKVRSFRVQAVHPAFIGAIVSDRWAPDFTSCDMSHDPVFFADKSRRVTFYEQPEFWLTGYTYPSFWRPASVPFRVGDRVEQGLHVVQLWVRYQERAEEVLVIEPPFDWDDVGGWLALERYRPHDDRGNVTDAARHLAINSSGTLIRAHDPSHVVVVAGVKDLVVVVTPDATLVADKHDEKSIAAITEELRKRGWTEYL
jgi:hypothetical protein